MNAETFRSVFLPAGPKLQQPRYRLRWDWHLRNLLTAMVPPACLYLGLKAVEWRFGGEDEVHRRLFGRREDAAEGADSTTREAELQQTGESGQAELAGEPRGLLLRIERRLQALEAEFERLKREREERRREDIVDRARRVAKHIRRGAVEE